MSELVREFGRLLQDGGTGSGGSTEALLRAMAPESAAHLRLCAIPHEFNATVLQVLVPGLNNESSRVRCDEFAELSCVIPAPDGFSLHDSVRMELFTDWLKSQNRDEFRRASGRLAKYFEALTAKPSSDDSYRIRRMFHLLGADQTGGFGEFEVLYRRARREHRASLCSNLIHLVDEYASVLTPVQSVWLVYYKGKLASDGHQWEQAAGLFNQVLSRSGEQTIIGAEAHLGLGYVLAEQRDLAGAAAHYELALGSAKCCRRETYSILRALGEVYRDMAQYPKAVGFLEESLSQAQESGDLVAVADTYNSLGTLYRQQSDPPQAIEFYRQSLQYLESLEMRFQAAQVYNNLGTAYADAAKWDEAEKAYEESLAIKLAAGDTLGQARSLVNLVQVYRHRGRSELAVDACRRAFSLFEEIRHISGMAASKHALGKIYAAQGNVQDANQSLAQAALLFDRAGDERGAGQVRHEMRALGARGLPWWAWTALVVFIVGIICLIGAVGVVIWK